MPQMLRDVEQIAKNWLALVVKSVEKKLNKFLMDIKNALYS
jgi:hypothetical protein